MTVAARVMATTAKRTRASVPPDATLIQAAGESPPPFRLPFEAWKAGRSPSRNRQA